MKIIWQNADGSLVSSTITVTDRTPEQVKDILIAKRIELRAVQAANGEPLSSLLNHVGFLENKDFPNAAQPEVIDNTDPENPIITSPAVPETVVEDYVIEAGLAVKKPVTDNLRHLRMSWRWDDVNKKIIEDVTLSKAIRVGNVRAVRNQLLSNSDSLEFSLTGQALADARIYRTALRDLGADIDLDPENVTFPVMA